MHSTFSASYTNNTTIGSTKGFFSFSSQSVFESQKGPSFIERLKANVLHLSANIHRYTGFNDLYHNIAMVIRLIQSFCIYLIPQCKNFWKMNSTTSFFMYLLELPLHLCVMPSSVEFHAYFLIILFIFFFISMLFILMIILKNPSENSISNSVIFFISFYFSVLTPVLSIFVFTLYGACLNLAVFQHNHSNLVITSCVLGSLTVIFTIISHYLSYYIMRGTSMINFSLLFVPWAPYISIYLNFNTYNFLLAFISEFVDVEQKKFQIIFSIFSFITANPLVIFYLFHHPIFQDLNDTVYLATILTVNMISMILMDFRFLTSKLTPVVIFVVSIICFVFFLILYNVLNRRIMMKYSKKMFTTYKHSRACLPPTTPLVFTTPMPTQSLLSHEAYTVMQAFSSLGITTKREYHYYMFVGTYKKMPALKNIDFIKWGLNYFHDTESLIICAQICQYFTDKSQTQAVLIQKLNETNDISFFMEPVIFNLVLYHADSISDKPAFLKKLQKKAYGGLVRCRRALSIFWGCVLKHSSNAMCESLCKLRDTIYETRVHFDELIRCYPISLDSIGLYLNFMTEISGEYIKCNQYINQMSSKFIEMKSDAIENDESVNGISVLLNDPNQSFSPYISKLTQYLDQESRTHKNKQGPIIAIWLLGIISAITLIICILIIMIHTLVSFNEYPKILKIVNSADDVFIEMASLIIGIRRVCLFASGSLDNTTFEHQHGMASSVYEQPENLLTWLIQRGEELPRLILRFYKNMTSNIEILNIVTKQKRKFNIFGMQIEGSLDFIMDMMSMAVRNIAINIPSYFSNLSCLESEKTKTMIENMKEEQKKTRFYRSFNRTKRLRENSLNSHIEDISNYSGICDSSEILLLMQNIEAAAQICDDFISRFQEVSERKVKSLSTLLYYSMILFPICYIVLFGSVLCFLCYLITKESNFRLTLFLSLPETVASEFYSSGGNYSNSRNPLAPNDAHINQVKSNISIHSQEKNLLKEKALKIESLYQFSMRNNLITGTGIKEYVISCSLFIIIATFSMFFLTFYSRSVNETFQSRSYMLCSSALRYSSFSYASMFIEEGFISSPCLSIFNNSEIIRLAEKFLERARYFNQILTYGNENIKFDFHEYENIENLLLNDVKMEVPDEGDFILEHSHALIQHNGYKDDSVDTFIRLFIEASVGIIATYKEENNYYHLNGSTWANYNHLMFSHLRSDLEMTTYYYITGVSEVIDKSFTIALIISIVIVFVLIILLIGPITASTVAISRYFKTTLHVLCQVPPDVFNRSFYINKWLKGQISRSNYGQFETTFKRKINNDLQEKILKDSDEKVIVFNLNGECIESPCIDLSSLKEQNLVNVLSFVVDQIDQNVLDEAENILNRFQESKDMIENVSILAKSKKSNKDIKLTFTGIQSSDLSSSIRHYYSHILILIRDVTSEEKIKEIYNKEREKTLQLYRQIVPFQIASKIHDGEKCHSFSATIGSVLSVIITNYDNCLQNIDLKLASEVIFKIREAVLKSLKEFDNVSLISFSGDELLFVAGLFNEEQNGRTESFDTLEFASSLFGSLSKIIESYSLMMDFKFGMATGGPIFCKIIGEYNLSTLIYGETVSLAKIIRDLCNSGQLLFERTTFECSEGLNINPRQDGEFDFQGKRCAYYSIDLDRENQIAPKNEL